MSIWVESIDNNARVCKPEYFKRSMWYNLLSFLDQAVEQQFLTSSARQIIISAATAEQLNDQLQSFIPVIDPSMSRINWSTKESRKKVRLDLSLSL